jgi:hypothetical protein
LAVSLLLAFATRLGLDQSFATFLVFGGMALLVLADFGGRVVRACWPIS